MISSTIELPPPTPEFPNPEIPTFSFGDNLYAFFSTQELSLSPFPLGTRLQTAIRTNAVYVTRDAVSGYWGSELRPCSQEACSTGPGSSSMDLAP